MFKSMVYISSLFFTAMQNLFIQVIVWFGVKVLSNLGVDMAYWTEVHTLALSCIIQILFYVKSVVDSVLYEIEEKNFEEEE